MLCVHAIAQRQTTLSQYAGHSTAYLGMFVLSRHAALLLAA